jgi:hypothetical protein
MLKVDSQESFRKRDCGQGNLGGVNRGGGGSGSGREQPRHDGVSAFLVRQTGPATGATQAFEVHAVQKDTYPPPGYYAAGMAISFGVTTVATGQVPPVNKRNMFRGQGLVRMPRRDGGPRDPQN